MKILLVFCQFDYLVYEDQIANITTPVDNTNNTNNYNNSNNGTNSNNNTNSKRYDPFGSSSFP